MDPQEIPYDYDFIMHYGAYDFAKNRRVPVIIPSDSNISPNRLGQRHMLSPYDIMQVNIRYCPGMIVTEKFTYLPTSNVFFTFLRLGHTHDSGLMHTSDIVLRK